MSSNVCLLALLLATAYSVLSAPFHVGSASSSQDSASDTVLSLENEYLVYLYRTIEVGAKICMKCACMNVSSHRIDMYVCMSKHLGIIMQKLRLPINKFSVNVCWYLRIVQADTV